MTNHSSRRLLFSLSLGPLSFVISIWRKPNGRGSYTLYAIGCRYYFTPLAGVLFTFPSRYWFTIGCQGVFSLIRWSGQIHAEFHVHRVTWDTSRECSSFRAPGSQGLWPTFPCRYH